MGCDGTENLEVVLTFRRNGQEVAQMILSSEIADAIFRGMPQAPHEVGPGLSIAHALDQYIRTAAAQKKAERYLRQVRRCVEKVAAACGWETVQDAAQGVRSLEDHLLALQERTSAKTRNNTLCAVRAFAAWLVEREELPANPFDRIPLARHFAGGGSRALSPVEMDAMIRVAEEDEAAPPERQRSGYIRSPWYRLAMATGLRALEMQRLRVRHLDLSGETPWITVPAEIAKGRRTQRIPLMPATAEWLQRLTAGRDPLDPLLAGSRPKEWVIRGDAKVAGLQRSGERVGMHSFRKGFITALAASGAPMSVTQELARHTDPRLTQSVYVDANLLPLKQALNALVATGYAERGKIRKEECLHPGPKADTFPQPQAMQTHQHNPETTAPANGKSARRPVVRSTPGAFAGADSSGETCGGPKPEQAGECGRQELNLPRSAKAILIAAADLLRATASALEAHDEQREEAAE